MVTRALIGTLMLALAILVGCDEGIAPSDGIDFDVSIYGQLDADADTQAVRVIRISDTIGAVDPPTEGITVTSTNVRSGETVAWQDSLVRFGDRSEGTVFFAPLDVGYEERYRLDVRVEGGTDATATVTVPPLATLDSLGRSITIQSPTYQIGVEGVPRLTGVTAQYTVIGDVPRTYTFRHTDRVERVEAGWTVTIPFGADAREILADSRSGEVGLLAFEVGAFVSNEEWNVEDAGGSFDPEVLVQPGTFTNVEGGFGFFGAGYRLTRTIHPDPLDVLRAGFCQLNATETACETGS